MADLHITGFENLEKLFLQESEHVEHTIPKMLEAGATVLVDAYKKEADTAGLKDSGGFIHSIKATKVKKEPLCSSISIMPTGKSNHGNERKGSNEKVTNATIGFIAEYGKSNQAARPWMETANEKSGNDIHDAMLTVWEAIKGDK